MDPFDLKCKGGLTLHEALQMIEEDESDTAPSEITLLPPENACGNISDADSGEEDNVNLDHFSGNQLRAPVEIRTKKPVYEFDEEDNIPLAELVRKTFSKRKKAYNWVVQDFVAPDDIGEDFVVENINMSSPLEMFTCIFDDKFIEHIVNESNRYAAQKNKASNITVREMKCFIGVLVISSYVQLPRRRMFWEREKDTHNDLVANAISRDRFEYIMSNIHFADNNSLNQNDKFAKIRPIIEHLNRRFIELAPLRECHSIDEAMVPYFGRHGCKQYIHGKPIRYGYKFWMGCTRLGYVNWMEPYQGASTHIGKRYRELGVGAGVVLSYADVLIEKWPHKKFHLFFDNFFTSCVLLTSLSDKGLRGTGTIRQNRIENNPFQGLDMKKRNRGEYEYRLCTENRLIAVQWNDNSIVNLCSNAVGVQPLSLVKRYSRKEKKSVYVDQPHLVKLYNANMGGVDRCDENISLYRISIRGKKWYFPLIAQCIDLGIHNAWQLHRLGKGDLDHVTFRRQIATALLQQNAKVSAGIGTGRPSQRENSSIRYDNMGHLVVPQDKQTRCRLCHDKTTTRCIKCNIGLHVKCFVDYHTM